MLPETRARNPAALLLAVSMGGCSGLQGLHAPPPAQHVESAPEDGDTVAAVFMAGTFQSMQRLAGAPPSEQAELFAAARDTYERSPQGGNKLRFALLLATPGHPARDPYRARNLLRELAAQPEALQPLERAVTLVELSQLNAELELRAENQKLEQSNEERSERDRSVAIQRRLQTEMDENVRLRKQLEDAQAKLDAIAHIERNLSQRNSPDSGGQP
jgi:hypothetical protein